MTTDEQDAGAVAGRADELTDRASEGRDPDRNDSAGLEPANRQPDRDDAAGDRVDIEAEQR